MWKFVDQFIYRGNHISSTESNINIHIGKAWIAIDRLSIIWKSYPSDKIKRNYIQDVRGRFGLCNGLHVRLANLHEWLWIEIPRPKNQANTYVRHTEKLASCFDLIRSHQQCIPWSPPLEIESATTDCRAKTLQLGHRYISHTKNADAYF